MAKVWVRCLGGVYYEKDGQQLRAQPGDWIEIGKHQARQELLKGQVEIPEPHRRAEAQDLKRCGILVRADKLPALLAGNLLERTLRKSPVLPYDFTVIWDPAMTVTQQAIEVGLMRLSSAEIAKRDTWEVLATLVSLTTLADSVGSPEERQKTKDAVGDLRLPVYETRLLWVRKTSATEELIKKWNAELAEGADEQHAFLRALYSSRVMMCTLPPDWHKKQTQWTP